MKLWSTTIRERATNEAWLRTWILVAFLLGLCGCTNHYPSWSKANPYQREMGFYVADDAYYASDQFQKDVEEDCQVIMALKEQLRHNAEIQSQ